MFESFQCQCIYVEVSNDSHPHSGSVEYRAKSCAVCQPLAACLGFIALSAWLNVAMSMHFRNVQRLAPRPVAWLLAYDIAQLTALMILTGGLENPFAFFILAPVSVAAISLPLRYTLPLGLFALTTSTLIAYFYWPLPWSAAQPMEFPALYIFATWVANLVAIVFIGAYAWQVAEDGRLLADE